mgnify:CR=1 FL=1
MTLDKKTPPEVLSGGSESSVMSVCQVGSAWGCLHREEAMFVQNPNTNRYRCLSFLLAGMMAVTSLPLPAFAADAAAGEEIAISAERFPDEQFRNYISEQLDSDGDNMLSATECSEVVDLNVSQQGIADMLYDRGMQILQAKEVRYGAPVMRELERICLLKCVDRQWMDHIDNMDQLRQGIALRGYGQKDPVVEYRIEGFDMFDQMVDSIRESSVKMLLTIELRAAGSAPKREQVAKPTGEGFVPGNGAPGVKGSPKGQPVRVVKIGRNDPCPCGSGLKFKKCTCAQYHPTGNNGGEE